MRNAPFEIKNSTNFFFEVLNLDKTNLKRYICALYHASD